MMPDLATEWGWVALLLLMLGYLARRMWERSQERAESVRSQATEHQERIASHKERLDQLESEAETVRARINKLSDTMNEVRVQSIDREDLDRFESRIQNNIASMKTSLDQRFDDLIRGLDIESNPPDED